MLANYTWFKIGGPAEIWIPESKKDLIEAVDKCNRLKKDYLILANGSNILVSDKNLEKIIINIGKACDELHIDGNLVTAGASVSLQKLITSCVNKNLGGIEFLFSVPGTVGGAVFMNAGRGQFFNQTISNYVKFVEVYDGQKIRKMSKDELDFKHRYSIFHKHPKWVILSATFEFQPQSMKVGHELIKKRMNHVRHKERSKSNAGSVFKSGVRIPLKGLRIGRAKFVDNNRICNLGNASFSDVKRLINLAIFLHRIIPFTKKPEIEICIWE